MKKDRLTRFLNNYYTKLGFVIFSALLLIMVSIVLFEDIDLDNGILIYNIFGTLTLIGFLYSYSLTKKNIRNDLCVGRTRLESYKIYMRSIFLVLMVALLLVVYYMLVYKLVIYSTETIYELFNISLFMFLALVFLLLSFLGFFLGMMQMRRSFFYSLVASIIFIVSILVLYLSIAYLFNIVLLAVVIILGVLNYFLIRKYDI